MDGDEFLESQIVNLPFLEEMYQQSRMETLDPSWEEFFNHFDQPADFQSPPSLSEDERIAHLIEAYRFHGHQLAKINPIALKEQGMPESLRLENLGFHPSEAAALFPTGRVLSEREAPLSAIVEVLQSLYCGTAGFEFKPLFNRTLEKWIEQEIESRRFEKPLSTDERKAILNLLTKADVLETFLHTKHVGKKRFSLEGAETLIPMLSFLTATAAKDGVEEFYIGMSHRGRLNVLANILNKSILAILRDFDDDYVPASSEGMGDIRYHKGHANDSVQTHHGKSIKLVLSPNPSHLESVNSVVEGQTRAQQFLIGDEVKREKIFPLLMHGDASLAGQGVVYETLQMSRLQGYDTGGTLHIVINNQIGFTTSPSEGRSTPYCTDIAKTFQVPVFHVNAEDPEMCVRVILFAYEIRQRFHCDVFIDLNCYRKYGHNEGDEPAFTQPLEYEVIRKKAAIRTLYLNQLLEEGDTSKKEADEGEAAVKQQLQEAYASSQNRENRASPIASSEEEIALFAPVKTAVELSLLKEVAASFRRVPEGFIINPKVKSLFEERARNVEEGLSIDWGVAELLAYGTLVSEGTPVRLAGQDSGRGTFSHRHALWIDQQNSLTYSPLAHIRTGQARFEVFNTLLSEAAALGFEYGYSTVCTEGLTLWEAQFGDFVNSAQVMIDQYIASGEQKWGQKSSLVLLLPHGFEGQGPEHSSARPERFLALAGHDNMQIVNPTTPAQLFHLLRRQVVQPFDKPLIVFTPKGLLRHPRCVSRIKEIVEGAFSPILDDPGQPKGAKQLILCSGRVYYDLEAYREKEGRGDLAIIRIEQLYPLDLQGLRECIAQYPSVEKYQWVQEEPENMGAWPFIAFYLLKVLPAGIPLECVGRETSASPATGFVTRHKQEFVNIIDRVFGKKS